MKTSFRIEKMWFHETSFIPMLKFWWESASFILGSRMVQLAKKLQFLKSKIKEWNKLNFRNIFDKKFRL